MATTAAQFTSIELDLLRRCHTLIGPEIAAPGYLRAHSERSGGGRGFHYEVSASSLHGTWHEWIEADWWPDGRVKRWRLGELVREATISHARVRRWAAGLPDDVRAKALRWWATYPADTRDLDRLDALARAAIDGEYDPAPAHPTLFDLEEVT